MILRLLVATVLMTAMSACGTVDTGTGNHESDVPMSFQAHSMETDE